jgi:hypothetical protein
MSDQIGKALEALLSGRDQLRRAHRSHLDGSALGDHRQEMTFALDGRLVGDIGELIAAEVFCIDLLGHGERNVDAVTTTEPRRRVQIKTTFQTDSLAIKHGSDYFIGLQLNDAGRFRVVYNGPARRVMDYLHAPKAQGHAGRRNAGSRLEPISLGAWAILNLEVDDVNRIARRTPKRTPD